MWCNLNSKKIAYADDSTLYATTKTQSDRLSIAESLNLDLAKINNEMVDKFGPHCSTKFIESSQLRKMNIRK